MNRFSEYFTAEEIEFLHERMPSFYGSLFDDRKDRIANNIMREVRVAYVQSKYASKEALDKETGPYRFDV